MFVFVLTQAEETSNAEQHTSSEPQAIGPPANIDVLPTPIPNEAQQTSERPVLTDLAIVVEGAIVSGPTEASIRSEPAEVTPTRLEGSEDDDISNSSAPTERMYDSSESEVDDKHPTVSHGESDHSSTGLEVIEEPVSLSETIRSLSFELCSHLLSRFI